MSLRLYLDDCAYDKHLAEMLRLAGHHVIVPADAGISKADDDIHLDYGRSNRLIIVTKNPKDFMTLHFANPDHSGIFVIYQDNDPGKDMTIAEIVKAIANLENGGINIPKELHTLNSWRY